MIWMDVRQWGWYGGETRTQGEDWARQLGDFVRAATAMGIWGGIFVRGGVL
jgi:hypothetical protein